MKLFRNSLVTGMHLAAWLIFLPVLLWLIFERSNLMLFQYDSSFGRYSIVPVILLVGFLNARFFIPGLLYTHKTVLYIVATFLLLVLGTMFDFTFSGFSDVISDYFSKPSGLTFLSLIATLVISSSVRVIIDSKEREEPAE